MDKALLEKLINHYKDGFSEDSDAFVEHFFARLKNDNVVYVEKDERIASAGYIVEKNAKLFGCNATVPYLSALSTATEFRGQSLMGEVMAGLLRKLYTRSVPFAFLYPFDHSYYKRYGFADVSFCTKSKIQGGVGFLSNVYSDIPSEDVLERLVAIERQFIQFFANGLTIDKDEILAKCAEYFGDGALLTTFVATVSGSEHVFSYCFSKDNKIYHYATENMQAFLSIEALKDYAYFNFFEVESPYIQARIVHVKSALEHAKFLKRKPFTLKIIDSLLDGNNKTYRVVPQADKNMVEETAVKANFSIDIKDLTFLLLAGDDKRVAICPNLFIDQY